MFLRYVDDNMDGNRIDEYSRFIRKIYFPNLIHLIKFKFFKMLSTTFKIIIQDICIRVSM